MNWNLIARQWRRAIAVLKSKCALTYRALSEAWIAKTKLRDHYPVRRIPS
ncbi:MAG: hypothetical protein WBY94_03695 [Polyangiaceae bacterium]